MRSRREVWRETEVVLVIGVGIPFGLALLTLFWPNQGKVTFFSY